MYTLITIKIPKLSRFYHRRVIEYFENPRNVGSFNPNEKNIGTAIVGAPACGDVMKLQIKVDDSGKIIDTKFKTFGCGSAIASSSYATEYIKGKNIKEAINVTNLDIAKYLNLPPVKLHCSMLAEDAIKSAIKDIEKKPPNNSSIFIPLNIQFFKGVKIFISSTKFQGIIQSYDLISSYLLSNSSIYFLQFIGL